MRMHTVMRSREASLSSAIAHLAEVCWRVSPRPPVLLRQGRKARVRTVRGSVECGVQAAGSREHRGRTVALVLLPRLPTAASVCAEGQREGGVGGTGCQVRGFASPHV